jgi:hypothetical protein
VSNPIFRSAAVTSTAAMAALLVLAAPVAAAPQGPPVPTPLDPFSVDFPAGAACEFPLRIAGGGGQEVTRTSHGVVRMARLGHELTFTNLAEVSQSVTVRSARSLERHVDNGDGTRTVTVVGSTFIAMFPSDIPAGPSSKYYTGRMSYIEDLETGMFTIVSTKGTTRDICAELA